MSLLPLLRTRHFIAATVVLTAFLCEFLVVALAGVAHGPGRYAVVFRVCGIFSITLLALMILVLVVMHTWKRGLPGIP